MLLKKADYPKYGLNPLDTSVPFKLEAIEQRILKVSANKFQVRAVRAEATSSDGALNAVSLHVSVGDTVEISASEINDGIYTVVAVSDGVTELDRALLDAPFNRMTLIRYPSDVVAGAVGMFEYDKASKGKENIASESLSRRSVTYVQPSEGNSIAGYPLHVMAFLKPYMRAWF